MSAETKATAIRQLETAWNELNELLSGISASQMEEPGVTGDWSVKDLLGHMAFWAGKAAGDLAKATEGRASDIETPGSAETADVWNQREAAARKGRPLLDLQAELESAHRATTQALAGIPPEALDIEVQGWTVFVRLGGDTWMHYRNHAQEIRAWLQQPATAKETGNGG
jgi:uncharacterized protein (TIGR03083 family)